MTIEDTSHVPENVDIAVELNIPNDTIRHWTS